MAPVVKPRKATKTAVSRRLDAYERAICLILAGNACQACKGTEKLQWCHVVKRARKALRFDRNNSLILCSSCHYRFDNLMTDRQRYRFVNKLKPDVYNYLDTQIGLRFELTLDQMVVLLGYKKQELEELRNETT